MCYTTGKAQVIAVDGAPLHSRRLVAEAAEESGVEWIDLMTEPRHSRDRQSLDVVRDRHRTAGGHRAVAEVSSKRPRSMRVLP